MSVLPLLHRVLGNAACAASISLALVGCATWQAPAEVSDAALRARAMSATERDVRVTAAVLSAEDSRRMFGADVNKTGVQSVWIEVQNRTSQPLWLLRSGTDPDYFSPLEVAWSMHTPLAGGTNASIDDHFDRLGFKNPIPPGATRTRDPLHQPTAQHEAAQCRSAWEQDADSLLPVPAGAGRPRG